MTTLSPDFWEARFQEGRTPWERPGLNPAYHAWRATGLDPCRILVPGAGRSPEPAALLADGFDVVTLDLADSAVAAQSARLGPARALQGDVTTWQPDSPFDAIYDQTCLCALPPDLWPAYAASLHRWLRPGGRLFILFMQTGKPGGPPSTARSPPCAPCLPIGPGRHTPAPDRPQPRHRRAARDPRPMTPISSRVMNLAHIVEQNARRHPTLPALIWGHRRWTWPELDRRVAALAAALRARGIGPGDRVLIQSRNCNQMFEAMWAVFRIGAIWVPSNFRQTPAEFAYCAEISSATAMILQSEFAEHAAAAAIPLAFSIGPAPFGPEIGDDLEPLAQQNHTAPLADVEHHTPCWLFFTSGTTGRPKAAVLTHGQLAFVIQNHLIDLMPGLMPGDASLVVAPLSHGAGMHQLAVTARAGTTVLLEADRFDPAEAWSLIERHRVTNLFTVPTIVKLLTEHESAHRFDHASLRYLIYAGAPMYREDQKHALRTLGPVLVQYFGLGEVTGAITVHPPALHTLDDGPLDGTCGYERTGMHVQIQDEAGQELPPGQTGEICVCGPAVFAGYWQNPDANAKSFRHGWFPHRRPRPHGRPGLGVHHRPPIRHVHLGRLQRLSTRNRRKNLATPRHRRSGHPRHARPPMGRSGRGRLRPPPRRIARRTGPPHLARRPGHPLQTPPPRRLLARPPPLRLRQDHQKTNPRRTRSPKLPSPSPSGRGSG